jgi:hypothetical protein
MADLDDAPDDLEDEDDLDDDDDDFDCEDEDDEDDEDFDDEDEDEEPVDHGASCSYRALERWIVTARSGVRYERCPCGHTEQLPPPYATRGIEIFHL